MKNWKESLISPDTPIRQAIATIDASSLQIALVVDKDGKLAGTVTDGDIRRGLLRELSLDARVSELMNRNPRSVGRNEGRHAIMSLMRENGLHQIPVLDENGVVIALEVLDELLKPVKLDNFVVLMAGGLGSRLRPLTENTPKPMLEIGKKPILEHILESLIASGFHRFFIAVNYRADVVRDYFRDGSQWGVDIRYLQEESRLGTAGALSLLPEKAAAPILVMNADLLTKLDFLSLLRFHIEHRSTATMCVRQHKVQIPYGVVTLDSDRITEIVEKPTQQCFINAGIYVIDPEVLERVPDGRYFDMPELFRTLISSGLPTAAFPVRELWIDIGHLADFERALNHPEIL
jgi:dTDP-glucose pyrophosphorylase/predicted transcriptional regulator